MADDLDLAALRTERDALNAENAILRRALGEDSEPLREEVTRRREAFKAVLVRAQAAEAERDAIQLKLTITQGDLICADIEIKTYKQESARLRAALQHMRTEVVLTYGWENPRLKPLYDEAEAVLAGDTDARPEKEQP